MEDKFTGIDETQVQIQALRVANGVSIGKSSVAFLSLSFVIHKLRICKSVSTRAIVKECKKVICTELDT